jgi:hypothetical protein
LMDRGGGPPSPFAVLSFSAAFDAEKVAAVYLAKPEKKVIAGKTIYSDAPNVQLALYFPDDRHIVIGMKGMKGTFEGYLSNPVAKDGPMAKAIAQAAAGKHVVAAVDLASIPIPEQELADLPPEVKTLLKAKSLLLTLDLGPANRLDFQAIYPDDVASTQAQTALASLADKGRTRLPSTAKRSRRRSMIQQLKLPGRRWKRSSR